MTTPTDLDDWRGPRRLGDIFESQMPWLRGLPRYSDDPDGFVEEFKRRAMAAQAKGNVWSGGGFRPNDDDDDDVESDDLQDRWTAIVDQ